MGCLLSPHTLPREPFTPSKAIGDVQGNRVRPGRPHSGTQSQVSTGSGPLPKGGAPQLPSLQGGVGEVVGSLQRVLILLLRLGVGRERNGGSSKEQLDSFGGGEWYHGIRVNAGLFIVLCLLEWGLHCLSLGGCASV